MATMVTIADYNESWFTLSDPVFRICPHLCTAMLLLVGNLAKQTVLHSRRSLELMARFFKAW
jgi:hypothetical protein